MAEHALCRVIPSRERLLLVLAVVAILATSNHLLLHFTAGAARSAGIVFGLSVYYILQIAAVCVFCGRGGDPTWLNWACLAWLLALTDLQLIVVGTDTPAFLLVAPLYAGQYGLLFAWAVMGTGRWFFRLPVVAALLIPLSYLAGFVLEGTWVFVVFHMVAAAIIILLVLRFLGFRMVTVEGGTGDAGGLSAAQFGLRHAMNVTTALAVLLGAITAMDVVDIQTARAFLAQATMSHISVGFASAIVVVLAFWASLGSGAPLLRVGLLLGITAAVGFTTYGWFAYHHYQLTRRGVASYSEWVLFQTAELGWQWVAWFVLTSGMLSACLILFRAQGFRLARITTPGRE
jgi:hypothetical protein